MKTWGIFAIKITDAMEGGESISSVDTAQMTQALMQMDTDNSGDLDWNEVREAFEPWYNQNLR